MTDADEKTINELIDYFLPCWCNAAQGSEAKKRFARYIDTLMRLGTGSDEETGPGTGEWTEIEVYPGISIYECTACHRRHDSQTKYCPNCGVKMEV